MSRLSDDHRSAGAELRTTFKWALVTIVLLSIVAIVVFVWAFNGLHYQ